MRTRPYGANQALEQWIVDTGYRHSPTAHCLHWVSVGRCGILMCMAGHRHYDWLDHISGWTKNGKRMLLCQPYHVTQFSTLVEACERFALRAVIHGNGWYGHGTVAIELHPLDGLP